jgi:chaperonin GroES
MKKGKKHLVVVGDRVLIKLEDGEERTKVGLYLPATAADSQAVQGGTVVATGPGQPLPTVEDHLEEPWKISGSKDTRYVPMQARVGDYALFFRKAAVEITFDDERYLVVPQAAILTLARND